MVCQVERWTAVLRQRTTCFPKPDGVLQTSVLDSNVNHELQELDRQLEYRHCKHKCSSVLLCHSMSVVRKLEVQRTCAR